MVQGGKISNFGGRWLEHATRGGGWAANGLAYPWECRAIQSRQARPEEALRHCQGGTLTTCCLAGHHHHADGGAQGTPARVVRDADDALPLGGVSMRLAQWPAKPHVLAERQAAEGQTERIPGRRLSRRRRVHDVDGFRNAALHLAADRAAARLPHALWRPRKVRSKRARPSPQ